MTLTWCTKIDTKSGRGCHDFLLHLCGLENRNIILELLYGRVEQQRNMKPHTRNSETDTNIRPRLFHLHISCSSSSSFFHFSTTYLFIYYPICAPSSPLFSLLHFKLSLLNAINLSSPTSYSFFFTLSLLV